MGSITRATIAGLLLAMAVPAAAQAEENDWKRLSRLHPGDSIHVVRADKTTATGTFRGNSEDGLSLETSRGELTIARSEIVRISKSRPARRIRNAALLGLAGATLGAASLRFGVACAESNNGCRNVKLATFGGAALLGGIGAALPASEVIYRTNSIAAPARPDGR